MIKGSWLKSLRLRRSVGLSACHGRKRRGKLLLRLGIQVPELEGTEGRLSRGGHGTDVGREDSAGVEARTGREADRTSLEGQEGRSDSSLGSVTERFLQDRDNGGHAAGQSRRCGIHYTAIAIQVPKTPYPPPGFTFSSSKPTSASSSQTFPPSRTLHISSSA